MLKWALFFFVIALIAGALGFTGVAAGAATIAQILFGIFLTNMELRRHAEMGSLLFHHCADRRRLRLYRIAAGAATIAKILFGIFLVICPSPCRPRAGGTLLAAGTRVERPDRRRRRDLAAIRSPLDPAPALGQRNAADDMADGHAAVRRQRERSREAFLRERIGRDRGGMTGSRNRPAPPRCRGRRDGGRSTACKSARHC